MKKATDLHVSQAGRHLYQKRYHNELKTFINILKSIQGRWVTSEALEVLDADLLSLLELFDTLMADLTSPILIE